MARPEGAAGDGERDHHGPDSHHVDAAEPRVLSLFTPAPAQWAIYERLQRFNVLVCHRGFGKTVLAVNVCLKAGVEHPGTRYGYVAPFRKQAKDIAWDDVLKPYASPIPGVKFNESDLECTLPNASRIQLFGADNVHAMRGLHLDGVVPDEFAQMRPSAWKEVMRPGLERKGGFAIFIGTPRGRNHFYDLFTYAQQDREWYVDTWPASRSGVFTEEQLARIRREQGPDLYAQEYECSWEAAIPGAFYARQIEQARTDGRIRQVTYEPMIPVNTYWDLGFTDATAIIFAQHVGREIHLIDYIENSGEDLGWYAHAVQERRYLYGQHYLPHDVGHTELGSGKTLEEQLRALGLRDLRVLGKNEPMDGINQARLIFPRVFFDLERCGRLIDVLAAYRAEWDEDKAAFKPKPRHDWASHGADAFRYMAVSLRDLRGMLDPKAPATGLGFKPYTYQKARRAIGVGFRPYR